MAKIKTEMFRFLFLLSWLILVGLTSNSQTSSLWMFYNVENLFDTIDDPKINDNEFLPGGTKIWTSERYFKKLSDLNKVISSSSEPSKYPDVLGVCEIENLQVLNDLVSNAGLTNHIVVHHDSPDQRGIDVALWVNKNLFTVVESKALNVNLEKPDMTTRDVLYVKLKKKKTIYHVYVNHWPSRRGGAEETNFKRMAASNVAKTHIDSILKFKPKSNIIIMGDFNDHPTDASLQNLVGKGENLINLAEKIKMPEKGTHSYKGEWGVLDQIIVSKQMTSSLKNPSEMNILKNDWMLYTNPKTGISSPSKTYGGPNYYGGFSDHLPVYFELVK